MTDISNFSLNGDTDSFKINNEYTGSVVLSGSVSGGLNTRSFNIPLTTSPDLIEIYINGSLHNSISYLPSNSWVKRGGVLVPDNAGYGGTMFVFGSITINGNMITIQFISNQQYTGTFTLTPVSVNYRIIDYSVY